MQHFIRTIIRGLALLVPFALTVYVIVWTFAGLEAVLKSGLLLLVDEGYYIPGLGIVVGIALIYALGLLASAVLIERSVRWFEKLIDRIPLVRTIYSSLVDLFSFFQGSESNLQQTGVVYIESLNASVVGFITQDDSSKLPIDSDDLVAFYIPMSYQIGGFTILVPRNKIKPTSMSVEQGLKFALTAGVSRSSQ